MTGQNGSSPVLVDSSGWIEYLGDGEKAEQFFPYLQREDLLIVPSIVFYEVYKKLMRETHRNAAMRFVSHALRGRSIPFDSDLALHAAEVSMDYRLAMADAIIYATARHFQAELVTGDHHFAALPGVTII